ncbi:CAP-Gly domain-containing linker protein 1-like isoform X3 [Lineus longissimus]|uniref:CAP-Gly domain-containing linker protein 1-like isoform X3 n=1 Tax=Lineus longissimus TaxID=88925 RepID=UPI00315D1F66
MASQCDSKIPSAGPPKEKRRSLLPAPKSYKRSAESSVSPTEQEEPAAKQHLSEKPAAKQSVKEETAQSENMPMQTLADTMALDQRGFKIGDRVTISGVKFGIVQYFGGVHFADGEWCGIELVDPDGKNDGKVGGYQYFTARPNHGIFAPVQKVELATNAPAFIPQLTKEKSPVSSHGSDHSAIKTTRLVQPGTFLSKLKPPDSANNNKVVDDVNANVPEVTPQGGKEQESAQSPKLQSKLARPKTVSKLIQPGTTGIPKPGEQGEGPAQKPTKLPGLFQSKKIMPTRTQSSEGWNNQQSSIPKLGAKQGLNSTFTKSVPGGWSEQESEPCQDAADNLNQTFPVSSPTLASPIPDLLTPNAYRPSESLDDPSFDQILTEEELANNDLLPSVIKSPVSPDVSKDSTELMEKELEQMSSLSSQDFDIPTPSLMTTATGSIAESAGSHQDLDQIHLAFDPSCNQTSTPDAQRAGLSETFVQGKKPDSPDFTDFEKPATDDLSPNSKLIEDTSISRDLNRTYVLNEDDAVLVERRPDLMTEETGYLPVESEIMRKKERPLSAISTSSVDTGYQPDTDSEMGTLTVNSPSDWPEGPAESHRNLPQAELMQRSYAESFETYNKAAMHGHSTHPAESDSDLFSDGTVVNDSETEKEDSEIDDSMLLRKVKALTPAEESDTESEAEDVEMEEINVKELATPTQEALPDFPEDDIAVKTTEKEGDGEREDLVVGEDEMDAEEEEDNDVDCDSLEGADNEKENVCPESSCDLEDSSQDIVVIGDDYDGRGGIMNLSIIDEGAEDHEFEGSEVKVTEDTKVIEEVGESEVDSEVKDTEGTEGEPGETTETVSPDITADKSVVEADEEKDKSEKDTPDNTEASVALTSEAKSEGEETSKSEEKKKKADGEKPQAAGKTPKNKTKKPPKKTVDVSPPKKPDVSKVRSSLADYINTPPPPPKPKPKEKEPDKVTKNIINKKKIESKLDCGTKTPLRTEKRSPDKSSPESDPPKIVKRTPVKNKWDDIMSKISENKETKPTPKKEIKSRLDNHMPVAPVVRVSKVEKREVKNDSKELAKRRLSAPVVPNYSAVKSKLSTQPVPRKMSLHPLTKKDNDSRASSVHSSRSSLNEGTKKATKTKPDKPNHKQMSSLRKDKSPSSLSVRSETSQKKGVRFQLPPDKNGKVHSTVLSMKVGEKKRPRKVIIQISTSTVSQVSTGTDSHSIRSKTDKVNNATKVNIRKKRQSLADISRLSTPSPAREATRRLSLGTTSTSRPGSAQSRQKAADTKKSLDKTDNSAPKRTTTTKDQKAPRKSSVSQIKGAHQPDLVSNSIGSRAHAAQEISRLEALCEARTKELNYAKMQLKAGIEGFDAMSIMVQYLTSELDAFSMPEIRLRMNEMQERMQILTTDIGYLSHLYATTCGVKWSPPVVRVLSHPMTSGENDLKVEKANLETMTHDLIQSNKETAETLKEEHRTTLDSLEDRLGVKHEEHIQRLHDQHSEEVKTLKSYHEKHLSEIKTENESASQELLKRQRQQLREIEERDVRHLTELQKQHEAKLYEITHRFEDIKVTLSDKVYTLKAECDELRSRSAMYEQALQRDTDIKVQPHARASVDTSRPRSGRTPIPKESLDERYIITPDFIGRRKSYALGESDMPKLALLPYRDLPQEIESLKAVLDMKNQEIHDLRAIKIDYEKQLEDLPPARDRIKTLEQKIENLEAIINIKSDYEKQLAEKHHVLMRRYDRESKANKRLSMDNEELMWRLTEDAPECTSPGPGKKIPVPCRSPSNLSDVSSPDGAVKRSWSPRSGPLSPGSAEVAAMISKVPMRRSKSRTNEALPSEKRTSSNNCDDETKFYQTL